MAMKSGLDPERERRTTTTLVRTTATTKDVLRQIADAKGESMTDVLVRLIHDEEARVFDRPRRTGV
jgi:hypothetical protein